MNSKNCIARRLREARLAFGISQKKLGILSGIDEHSASTRMNQYETGRHIPNFSNLRHIGKVLGYPVAFFYAEDDVTAEIICLLDKLPEAIKKKALFSVKSLLNYDEKLSPVE